MKTVLVNDIIKAPNPSNYSHDTSAVRFASFKKPMPIFKRPTTKKGKVK